MSKTIQKYIRFIDHEPRMIQLPFKVERVGFIENKTEVIDRVPVMPSIMFIFSGSGFIYYEGRTVRLEAPFVMWNKPGVYTKYWPSPTWEELYIGFSYDSQNTLKEALSEEIYAPLLRKMQNPIRCRQLAEEMRLLLGVPRLIGIVDRIDQLALMLLTESTYVRENNLLSRNEKTLQEITEYINFHFRESLNLREVAEKHGWSYSSFQRQWRLHNACSPKEYLNKLLNSEAIRMLSETDRNVGETAAYLGFNSQFYFSKFFHDMNGMSPDQFKRLSYPNRPRKY